ncbi:MAG: T9SS type A sorting domain-containing protein [Bacteroidales bacterium]|nr:T9SS type A sorting domain-containing protein [Bacteroidales bacterium]
MKTKFTALLFICLLFAGNKVIAQTYGLFTETDDWKTEGSLGSGDTPNGGWYANDDITVEQSFDAYMGGEALKVTMAGAGGGRLYFTYNLEDPNGSSDDGRFVPREDWNDDFAFLVCYIKLLTQTDIRLEIRSNRNGGVIADGDESMAVNGLDTTMVGEWQKFILPLKHGEGEWDGNQMSYEEWAYFVFRDRDNVGEFLVDEVYVDYRPKTTYGIFADLAENKLSGSLATDARLTNSGIVDDGTISEILAADGINGTEALKVSLFATGGGRTQIAYDKDDWSGAAGSADFSQWRDVNTVLVLNVKLITPMDFRLTYSAFREDNQKIDETDISAAHHGMDATNIVDWQKIVVPINPGWEGRNQDPAQWSAFGVRDRDNTGDFIIDEVYVISPAGEVGINKIKSGNFNVKNYPNPVNGVTTFEFNLSNPSATSLCIYNPVGQKVASVVEKKLNTGNHKISFDASELPAGIYFYELKAGSFRQSNKMLVIK